MAIYLLIGPSGIGKSTAIKNLAVRHNIVGFSLDKLITNNTNEPSISDFYGRVGQEQFFTFSKGIIEGLPKNKDVVIDVGAGSIAYEAGHKWLKTQNLIALVGDAKKIYERSNRQRFHNTAEVYEKKEFTDRMGLYQSAQFILDVTNLNPQVVADKLFGYITSNVD